jgi:hypothetical protein
MDAKKKKILAGIVLLFALVVGFSFLMPKGDEAEYDSDDEGDDIDEGDDNEEGDEVIQENESTPSAAEATVEPQPVEESPVNQKTFLEPAPVEITVEKKKTTAKEGGNVIHLAEHEHSVDCGENSILNQFHMNREYDANRVPNHLQYNYTCHTGHKGNLTDKKTADNDSGGGNLIFLDRHTVDCEDKFINQFKLLTQSAGTMRYDYKCSDTPVDTETCRSDKISPQEDGGGNVIYLDRQNVSCNEGEALTKFRLSRPSGNTVAYEYTCCKTKQ